MTRDMNKSYIRNHRLNGLHGFKLAVVFLLAGLMAAGSVSAGVVVTGNVYGGGNKADVGGSVTVNIKAGTVVKDVYGGGALANTNIKNVTAGYRTDNETIPQTSTNKTAVNLRGGTINGNVYGGGLGRQAVEAVEGVEAIVYGDVTVTLNGTKLVSHFTGEGDDRMADAGQIFGCNNLNGTPKGHVKVHVKKTVDNDKSSTDALALTRDQRTTYDVAAVYGGGNQANYEPVDAFLDPSEEGNLAKIAAAFAEVLIEGCDATSIEYVYGGGNAAAVPATEVTVKGTYIIDYVFGGGNGKSTSTYTNPGADVGIIDKTAHAANPSTGNYGTGKAVTKLIGGKLHVVFGGSNTKGNVRGGTEVSMPQKPANAESPEYCPVLDVREIYGAGQNAEQEGGVNLILGCVEGLQNVYGGARNANIAGGVNLTITSGEFENVFGGNDVAGTIQGPITLNIEETACDPIIIHNLYLGGNKAAYSIYGYYNDNGTLKPRISTDTEEAKPHVGSTPVPYADPVLNVISCTRVDNAFGGGYGSTAVMYGSPTVNINMIPGDHAEEIKRSGIADAHDLGAIGNVFGGGNEADVVGNTTVNIGTATTVTLKSIEDDPSTDAHENEKIVEGANIAGNVYGGGNEANVLGNTQVNVCAVKNDDPATTDVVGYSSVTISGTDYEGVVIKGNVFGGGKGVADNFFCNKAMVGEDGKGKTDPNYAEGNTNVIIGNGTVEGTVYGGGQIGRVEMNTTVTIGLQEETSEPVIKGNVFGAGKGLETHGYAALVRGNPTVTVQGHAKAEKNVYGGGEIASVARYNLVTAADLADNAFVAAHPGLGIGMPYALATVNNKYTGKCTVIVRDHAEVGTETDGGNVFGAGKGILPTAYDNTEGVYGTSHDADPEHIDAHKPKRMILAADKNKTDKRYVYICYDNGCNNVWEYFPTVEKYVEFIQTQALSSQTDVTISGNATVRGSVYGGSENGIVQYDAHVNVTGGTIGVGQKGGVTFGNVFGAGKGYVDTTRPENLLAGIVRGNTFVTITDGTILHNVYGGGAYGSVGTITTGNATYVPGLASVSNMPLSWARKTASETSFDTGTATVTITGGTIGFDGHNDGMVFGSSRGDVGAPGTILDHQAWVYEAHVIIGDSEHPGNTTTPVIRGSIYGSGENGHVFTNTVVDIHGGIIGLMEAQEADPEGSEGADFPNRGNVYGGGCGTDKYYASGTAPEGHTLTDGEGDTYNALSGCVLGNATVNIDGGHVVHNVYGAGSMGSVGKKDDAESGKTTITISGGRIGDDGVNDGNVYGAARGEQGISNDLAHVRETEVNISYTETPSGDDEGKTTQLIAGSVFGGGEAGTVKESVVVNMNKGMVLHDVYGGGALADTQTSNWDATNSTWTNPTNKSSVHTTQVNLKGGTVKGDMYGGGLGRLQDSQANPAVTAVEAKVYGDVTVTTTGGKAARVFCCNNLNGAPQGKVAVNINGTDTDLNVLDETAYAIGNVYGGGNQAAYTYTEHPLTVTMAGGSVNNVFGGGLSAEVAGSIAVSVTGGKVVNDVYGGGALAHTNTANWNQGSDPLLKYVPVTGLTVGTTSVAGYYIQSGDDYSLITDMVTAAANTTYYKKTVGGTWATTHPYTTTVDLTGGIVGNVYGGGLGQLAKAAEAAQGTQGEQGYQPAQAAVPAVEANVYGDVTVTVNDPAKLAARLNIPSADAEELASTGGEGVAFTQRPSEKFTIGSSTTEHTISVTGHVFGCNNINGTPTGNVTVHVYSTRQLNEDGEIIPGHTPSEIGNENEKYEIQGVYGGGNLADYLPADEKKTCVLIDGCGVTSIKKVFGGGNSALVPATDVRITGSYAIGYAFGGGNGGDYIKKNGVWQDNEGAIVIGTASIACKGGKVGSVFGGSDARGVCGHTNINTNASQVGDADYCPLKITRIYGAGNEADVSGNVNTIISGCTSEEVEFVHGGSYNAHVSGNVTLTITSGILQNVYGGNDARGSIGGNITVNIEETETSCDKPIIIQNLVGGGNNAPYPGTNRAGVDLAQNENWQGKITVNVKSATRIDNVYGGCFNAQANADTEVNINMLKGRMANHSDISIPKRYYADNKVTIPNITYTSADGDYIKCTIKDEIGTIGNVFGGGKEGKVVGNTTVNIGTATKVDIMARNTDGHILDTNDSPITYTSGQNIIGHTIKYVEEDVLGANITENVYGGGELADVTGNTFVNICANKGAEILDGSNHTGKYNYTLVDHSGTTDFEGVKIAGNVYGGGKGKADNFFCNKAMVGVDGDGAIDANEDGNPDHPEGGTTVVIANGTVNGNVYGGGEIARVEKNSDVTIGLGAAVALGTPTSAPVIEGDVFGAGKGVETHGYSALVRGNPSVTIQANAKVRGSVYGGGEIGSVARYQVVNESPVALENNWSGNCVVKVQGYAEIGPDNMTMPTFSGNVFGAGKGVLPVDYFDGGQATQPRRMISDGGKNSWQYFAEKAAYLSFIETLALASQTSVTISDHAFVKGSVYGGSENGIVQYDTHVKIEGDCQIGCGKNMTSRHEVVYSNVWTSNYTPSDEVDLECDHWTYGKATEAANKYLPYDKFANTSGYTSYASTSGDDGHTFYGNVFGGGSGYFPYAPGTWHRAAGIVRGNTLVDITGGHILTSVYGGNEQTDVGTYTEEENTHALIVHVSGGKCTVNFGGTATLGVPRTLKQIKDHPVTCYLFGSGKGDPRTFFNTWTNVNEVEVNITGGVIYGSVFGGGEDGHVLGDVKVNISDDTNETSHINTKIGTWGTSYVDGNVFGGGRGFTGDALTAGSTGGNVILNISGGTMLGSIYGGGRLASVGIGFTDPGALSYGQLIDDETGNNPKTYGHITMNITGGTIGNANAVGDGAEHSGNVFGGSMGRLTLLNGNDNPLWPKLAVAKTTTVNISEAQGKTTLITRNVYGGSEFGIVRDQATVTISSGTVNGSVFGGGYGSSDSEPKVTITPAGYSGMYYTFTPMMWAGCVSGNTTVNISGGTVKKNVYGGGEYASVGLINFISDEQGNFSAMTKHADPATGFALSWPYEFHYIQANPLSSDIGGKATVTITGSSIIGTENDTEDKTGYVFGGSKGQVAFGATDDIEEQRYTEAFCANVRETEVIIGTSGGSDNPQIRTVYGGGEDGHVYEDAKVILHRGTIGHSVFGGGKGESTYTTTLLDATEGSNQGKPKTTSESAHSWTAGRVYGNTSVTMNGGSVGWFIYGGGNMASVGKGNYSGGKDDYSTVGYGELPSENGNLWTTTSTAESETKDDAYHFLNSGIATVNLFGGTVGTGSGTDEDGIPYGSVFGGSRGQAAASCKRSPRYMYVPDFFLGYVNKAIVNIGKKSDDFTGDNAAEEYAAYVGPTIYGSVYGGGQDGHVRNSTEVKIYKGKVQGLTSDEMGRSGNVFGAGSGIGTYVDGAVKKVNNSSGSVTCTTLVEVNGGTIKGSVYGGGALASVGPPKTGGANQTYDEKNTSSGNWESYSYSQVNIKGGSIGGNVFGASRGPGDSYLATNPNFDTTDGKYDATKYATDIWSNVHVSGGKIGYDSNGAVVADGGSVYGGGETGQVKCGVTVNITGGEIAKDVYGGGALAHTNTSNLKQGTDSKWSWTDTTNRTAKYTTTVNLLGGTIGGDAYGGGLGRQQYLTSNDEGYVAPVEATVYGDVKVNLNGLETADIVESVHGSTTEIGGRLEAVYGGRRILDDAKGAIVTRVFGCNNLNGSPQGKVRVHVFGTQNREAEHNTINKKYQVTDHGTTSTYDVEAVYGGANLAPYTPMGPAAPGTETTITTDYKNTTQRTEVIIDGCDRTSIKQVYGGGNAASAPATYVEVNGTYEIQEVFGGGNGADTFILKEGDAEIWHENPGANVGYENYTHWVNSSGSSPGTQTEPYHLAVENSDASTPEARKTNYSYGSGVATTAIKGGTIHYVYGGSNKKGNISTTAMSMIEGMDDCPLHVDESYGGGKDAPIDGTIDSRSDCAKGVKELFGGSKNADVNSDVVLTITNGSSFERVFGGNNTSGAIAGSITVNIKEGGCEPIIIKELYAGGYLAPYSIYGYERNNDGSYTTESIDYGGTIGTISQRKPLTKVAYEEYRQLMANHKIEVQAIIDNPQTTDSERERRIVELAGINEILDNYPKKDPRINVISATRIDDVFGGGYRALVVGSPHVNVNMTNGKVEVESAVTSPAFTDVNNNSYDIANVATMGYYVMDNGKKVTVEKVERTSSDPEGTDYTVTEEGKTYVYKKDNTCYKVANVKQVGYATLDVGTIGNIYGGGNMADIYGDTYVEIGTGKWLSWDANGDPVWESTPARNAAKITGNVFGGGKGLAEETGDDAFTCVKAMVGIVNSDEGSTNVTIGNGTVEGNVYGGGEIGRVEKNTSVTIGLETEAGNSAPEINGSVFGAGKGIYTHGYSGLVRGNSTVTVQNHAKVGRSVYGGGEMASVGKYSLNSAGMPVSLVSDNKGICKVIIKDYAEIGPDNMTMTADGGPDDTGYVFGAGRGVLPYKDPDYNTIDFKTENNPNGYPWRIDSQNKQQYYTVETDYLKFIETLALATQTDVTVGGHAFIKGSVYGGSENGIVQHNTHVTIQDDCQIGNGYVQMDENGIRLANPVSVNRRYTDAEWAAGHLFVEGDPDIVASDPTEAALRTAAGSNYQHSLPECASWEYKAPFAAYDKYNLDTNNKPKFATDGHTFYGNVFGGGSGLFPYKRNPDWTPKEAGSDVDENGLSDGLWHEGAGAVYGNTVVEIKGGHILTSVYGGNEMTNVGKADDASTGLSTVKMSGGTLGVPRTLKQIAAHPVTCYLFGAGKGDQRVNFNTSTNVNSVLVEVTDEARIYGSVFGGGEDGHVLGNVNLYIKEGKDMVVATETYRYPYIGTWGTSYVDGNIFGAGRGFSGDAITAGSVGGNVEVNISDGTMLGSIYGGGRLASVGIGFNAVTDSNYGQYTEDEKTGENPKTYGHVTVNISGGTIGNDNESLLLVEHTKGGNVFGGGMGRLELLNGDPNPLWPQLGLAKTTTINISGGTIKSSVYGGGEMGTVRDKASITISGGTVNCNVYGGGYGSKIMADNYKAVVTAVDENNAPVYFGYTPMIWAGCVGQETNVNISGGRVKKSVYGGGEMASVGIIDCRVTKDAASVADNEVEFSHTTGESPTYTKYLNMVKHADESNSFALSWPYEFPYMPGYGGKTNINITGGRIGLTKSEDDDNPFADKDNGDVYGGGKGIAGDYKEYLFCANVGSTNVTINYPTTNNATPENYMGDDPKVDCIAGAVYGGAENGHVMGDTKVTLTNGLIGHSMYGGGSGKGQFKTWLTEIPEGRRTIVTSGGSGTAPATRTNDKGETEYEATCYSITAGKVFGNTEIEMAGGYVLRNIYGGGNMGSVGKGNYAGGLDDYSTAGYGETLNGNTSEAKRKLWTSSYDPEKPISDMNQPDNAWYFLNSGKCKVTVIGGTIGYVNATDPDKSMYPLDAEKKPYSASLPYGNIFGGCRGESAPNILESPRYLYCPEFFVGYANETEITVGTLGQDSENAGEPGKAPRIWGSVYGGGQDGHIRRDASVTINSGEIGMAFTYDNRLNHLKTLAAGTTEEQAKTITSDLDNLQWLARGNVYGAGSGMGKYKYDINHDGDFGDKVNYTTPTTPSRTTPMAEEDNSTSAGSVTRFTKVEIKGGKIHRNVYGGGSLSTVGAPKIGQTYLPYRKGDTAKDHGEGKQSLCEVIISGTIGTPADYQAHYGGEVYGASRGNATLGESFANSVWTQVKVLDGAHIQGNVFGGGDAGIVKRDSEVIIGATDND